jgi:hypothetical protein
VGDRAALIVDVPGRPVRWAPVRGVPVIGCTVVAHTVVVVVIVIVVIMLMLMRRTCHAYELAIRYAAGQPPPRRAGR